MDNAPDKEAVFDALLSEASGNDAPDLTLAILQAASAEGSVTGSVPAPTSSRHEAADVIEPHSPKQGRLVALLAWTAAACAIVAIGWVVLFSDPQTPPPTPEYDLPATVAVIDGEYDYEGEDITLKGGLAVMREGAPPLHVGESSLDDVQGIVLVRPGEAPGENELEQIESRLRSGNSLKPEEIELMKTKKWIVRGGVAVCVLIGSVALNGDVVEAQMVKRVKKDKAETVDDRAEGLMKRWDKDADGSISKEEGHEEIMSLDSNEDGEVSLEEAKDHFRKADERKKAAIEAEKKRWAEIKDKADTAGAKKADDFISKLDKDKDGKVSAKEAEGLGDEADGWMKKLDADKNGEISKEEADGHFKKESLEEAEIAAKKAAEKREGPRMGGMRRSSSQKKNESDKHEGSDKAPERDSDNKKD